MDDKYYQEVSPDGVAFAIVWPIIYVWNTIAIAYIAISVFLPARKSPVNTRPTLVPIVSGGNYVSVGVGVQWASIS